MKIRVTRPSPLTVSVAVDNATKDITLNPGENDVEDTVAAAVVSHNVVKAWKNEGWLTYEQPAEPAPSAQRQPQQPPRR